VKARNPILLTIFLLTVTTALAQTNAVSEREGQAEEHADVQSLEPEKASRGSTVTVAGDFPSEPVIINVELRSVSEGLAAKTIAADNVTVKDDGQSFSFVIPVAARLGRYDVLVTFSKAGKRIGPLTVPISEGEKFRIVNGQPVKIEAVYPVVSYPEKDSFGFKIIGEGFSPIKEDNALVVEGIGLVPLCTSTGTPGDCVNEEIVDPGREISFSGLALRYKGVQNVRIRVGDEYSEKPIAVTLSQISRKVPGLIAVFLVLLLLLVIWLFLRTRPFETTDGRRISVWRSVFLEKDTNTYSLSKLQFYLWTLAALLGYIYLSVSTSLVQGKFEFADVPENLPGILAVTVSTAALAVGITSAKGPKGAGEQGPALADFVTTGGLVAAERVQFLAWTIIGVAAFVFLTFSTEPGRIENLPAVPERFLYLMGISSFGYLGGKLARKPGPVITQIIAETGSLTLQIQGSNLSPDATFKIDEQECNASLLDKTIHLDGRPEIVTKDEDPGYAKVLRFVIDKPLDKWLSGDHKFTITNPDGQKAVLNYSVGARVADSSASNAIADSNVTEVSKSNTVDDPNASGTSN